MSEEIKHTPGSWEVEGSSIMAVFEDQEVQVACISPTSWSYPDGGKTHRLREQSKANANLIAAAPELLEELERLVRYYEPNETRPEAVGKIIWAKQAIDKARGES